MLYVYMYKYVYICCGEVLDLAESVSTQYPKANLVLHMWRCSCLRLGKYKLKGAGGSWGYWGGIWGVPGRP